MSKFLGLLITFFGIHFAEYGVFGSEKSFDVLVSIFGYRFPFRLLVGPLIFLFAERALNHKEKSKLNLFHFIPPVLSLLFLLPFFQLSLSEKALVLRSFKPFDTSYYAMLFSILWLLSLTSLFFYFTISLRKIIGFGKRSFHKFSKESKLTVLTSKQVLLISTLVTGGYIICLLLRFSGVFHSSPLYYLLSIILMGLLVFYGFRIAAPHALNSNSLIIPEKRRNPKNRKALDGLGGKDIKLFLREKQYYLDHDYSIDQLAVELGINRTALSTHVNSTYGTNFPNLINTLRIDHSKILLERTNLKILAVALDSGFSNKTNFHRVFKRMVGTTPSKFRIQKDKIE